MAIDKHKIWLISSIVIVILIIGFIFLYPNVKKGLAGQAFKVGTCNDPDSNFFYDPAQLLIKATTIKEAKQNEDHCKLKDGNLLLYEGICTNTGSIGFWPYNCSKLNKLPDDKYECVESVGACVNTNEVPTCLPQCVGKACGDNGCGGVCGICGAGSKCQNNICKTKDNFLCTETDNGKDPTKKGTLYSYNFPDGKEDECDPTTGMLSEKYCSDNEMNTNIYTCLDGFKCENGACINPDIPPCTLKCDGKTCGDDGCGGSCGICTNGNMCDASGNCVPVPNCKDPDDTYTPFLGKGMINKNTFDIDSLNQMSIVTGLLKGVISSQPDKCSGLNKVIEMYCVNQTDISWNGFTCPTGKTCNLGACICTSFCTGKTCGDDGCGGSCGSCAAGEKCESNKCTSSAPKVIDGDVTGASGSSDNCVNLDDIAVIAANVNLDCVPQSNPSNIPAGDINKDGCVNLDDIAVIAANVNLDCVPS